MKALSVTYERLKSLPGYNHIKLGVTVEVGHNETADQAMKAAEKWVHERLGIQTNELQSEIPF